MSNEKKYLKFRNNIGYGIGYGGYAMTSSLIMNFTLLRDCSEVQKNSMDFDTHNISATPE